jgi:hypothetical protein
LKARRRPPCFARFFPSGDVELLQIWDLLERAKRCSTADTELLGYRGRAHTLIHGTPEPGKISDTETHD